MIVLEDVYKRYQTAHGFSKWVIEGVSVVIPQGVNVGIVGKNGAGKSTLLNLIGGADQPSRGRIERKCRVSWPMGFAGGLQKGLTGRQNAKFVCRIHGHEEDISERLRFIKDFSELGAAFDEPTGNYSSGMNARLKFAMSLAFEFDVYISDELTAVGDLAFKNKARDAFRRLVGKAGLIMVAHQTSTLKEFCSAGIWVNAGKAYWFDDINDAISAYHESVGVKGDDSDDVDETKVKTKPSAKNKKTGPRRAVIGDDVTQEMSNNSNYDEILTQGIQGEPITIDFGEGKRLIKEAKDRGMVLVPVGQLPKLGYRLKENVGPVVRRRSKKTPDTVIDLYDLRSQCEKVKEE